MNLLYKISLPMLFAGLLLGQNPNTAQYPGAIVTDQQLLVATNNANTTLTSSMTSSQTTISLTSGTYFVAPVAVRIDSELVDCTTLTTNTLSGCTRGFDNTTATTHNSGAPVYGLIIDWHINQPNAEIKAVETALGVNLGNVPGALTLSNDTSTGTTLHNLAKLSAANKAIITTTSDTAIPVFIVASGAGTSGAATLAVTGSGTCQMDSVGATAQHFIGQSTLTGGRCGDLGATAPTTGWVIGQAQTTVAANATVSVLLSEGYNAAASALVSSVFGQTGAVTLPATTTDVSTPSDPTSGKTTFYTKNGTFCSLSPAGAENCTGGNGATTFSQLNNGKLVYTSSTVITIDPNCSSSAPCVVNTGGVAHIFTTSPTATISAGSPTAYFYVDTSGNRTVAIASGTVTCAGGCVQVTGSSFPPGAFIYGTWTAASGTWNSGGYTYEVAPLTAVPPITQGTCIVPNGYQVSIDPTCAELRKVCMMVVGADNGSALANADLGPQGFQCYVPFNATVLEVMVSANASTPSVVPARNHAGVVSDLVSSALPTAASGARACSNVGGTLSLDGVTTCSGTLQNTSLSQGDEIDLDSGGVAGGTAARMSVAITYVAQ